MKQINERLIRSKMVLKDISMGELARQLGCTDQSLRNKLQSLTEFSLSEALKLCELIELDDIEELYDKE